MKVTRVLAAMLATLMVVGSAAVVVAADPLIEQDPVILRFVERAIPWYPDSSFRVVSDERTQTPSGSYRIVRGSRTCENKILTGEPSVVIDEMTGLAYLGSAVSSPSINPARRRDRSDLSSKVFCRRSFSGT